MTPAATAVPRDARRIAFLRPGAVGDFVFALPALHALRWRYPQAEIVYIGRRWHADFLAHRPGPIDRVAVMPPCAGIGLPADAVVAGEPIRRFTDALRAEGVDLAIQAFGGGRYSNPFVRALGARFTIGLRAPDAPPLDRCIAFAPLQNRRLQLLELVALADTAGPSPGRELQVTQADRDEAARVLPPSGRPLIVIQPGASDSRRRWPARRFAAVADALAGEGAVVAVNGTLEEAVMVREVVASMRRGAVDLSGRLSLGGLCGLLQRAALLVSNDTGPLHLAVAIGTPAVGIYWLTNLIESQPLRQEGHRAALAHRVNCPVCGVVNLAQRCPHDESFVADVEAEEVIQLARELGAVRSRRRA